MRRILFTLSLVMTACDGTTGQVGGQTGEIAAPFCDEDPTELEVDAVTPMGFTMAEALENHEGGVVDLLWWDGSQTEATWSMERDTTQFEGIATHYPTTRDPRCRERVEVPVLLQIRTADGRLDVSMHEWFVATAVEEGSFDAISYVGDNRGTLDLTSLAGSAWDGNSATLYTVIDFDDAGTTGVVELNSHSEGSGDAVLEAVATW